MGLRIVFHDFFVSLVRLESLFDFLEVLDGQSIACVPDVVALEVVESSMLYCK